VSQPDYDTVRRVVNAQWRYDRLISIETGLLDLDLRLYRIGNGGNLRTQNRRVLGRSMLGVPSLETGWNYFGSLNPVWRDPFCFKEESFGPDAERRPV
jgi:hypothetical protein